MIWKEKEYIDYQNNEKDILLSFCFLIRMKLCHLLIFLTIFYSKISSSSFLFSFFHFPSNQTNNYSISFYFPFYHFFFLPFPSSISFSSSLQKKDTFLTTQNSRYRAIPTDFQLFWDSRFRMVRISF